MCWKFVRYVGWIPMKVYDNWKFIYKFIKNWLLNNSSVYQPAPIELIREADKMTFKSVTTEQLNFIFSKRDYVVRLTDCIVHIGYCNINFGLELYSEYGTLVLKRSGKICCHQWDWKIQGHVVLYEDKNCVSYVNKIIYKNIFGRTIYAIFPLI